MRHLSDGNLDRVHAKYKINIIRNQQRLYASDRVMPSATTHVKRVKKVCR